jgi:hypothetical protein
MMFVVTEVPDPGPPRASQALATGPDGRLYRHGGRRFGAAAAAFPPEVEVLLEAEWGSLPSPASAPKKPIAPRCAGHSMCAVGGELFTYGGRRQAVAYEALHAFSPATNSWRVVRVERGGVGDPGPLFGHCAAFSPALARMYIAGGVAVGRRESCIFALDVARGCWVPVAPPAALARTDEIWRISRCACAVWRGRLYVVGWGPLVWRLTEASGVWEPLPQPVPPAVLLGLARATPTTDGAGSWHFVAAPTRATALASIWVFSFQNEAWAERPVVFPAGAAPGLGSAGAAALGAAPAEDAAWVEPPYTLGHVVAASRPGAAAAGIYLFGGHGQADRIGWRLQAVEAPPRPLAVLQEASAASLLDADAFHTFRWGSGTDRTEGSAVSARTDISPLTRVSGSDAGRWARAMYTARVRGLTTAGVSMPSVGVSAAGFPSARAVQKVWSDVVDTSRSPRRTATAAATTSRPLASASARSSVFTHSAAPPSHVAEPLLPSLRLRPER